MFVVSIITVKISLWSFDLLNSLKAMFINLAGMRQGATSVTLQFCHAEVLRALFCNVRS